MPNNNYFHTVLQPFAGEKPCGMPPDYDPDFILLQTKLQPRQSAEYGDFIEPPEPLNWIDIERDCLKLVARSKDIRLIIILMRCRLRQIGLEAVEEGLMTLYQLLTLFPDELHPQLYDEGEYEPLFRINAFGELENTQGFLTELRNTELPRASGMQLTIKDLENMKTAPHNGMAFSDVHKTAMQAEWKKRNEPGLLSLQRAWYCLRDLKKIISNIQGVDMPLFTDLENILRLFIADESQQEKSAVLQEGFSVKPVADSQQAEEITQTAPPQKPPHKLISPLQTRADALSRLRELRTWFIEWEPSSPVILLLEFAEKITGMRFPEIIKQFPHEIIARLEGKEE